MGGVGRRVARLEAQFAGAEHPNEEHEKRQWLARAHLERNRAIPNDVRHARSLIALFRVQDELPKWDAEELIDRIVSWRWSLPEGGRELRRPAAVMEVSRVIYNREPGTENMVCPPQWRESFVAGDELLIELVAIPDEVLAEVFASESEAAEKLLARFGITEGLERRAAGPDVAQITEEEHYWRLQELLADVIFGEKGYRILKVATDEQLRRMAGGG